MRFWVFVRTETFGCFSCPCMYVFSACADGLRSLLRAHAADKLGSFYA